MLSLYVRISKFKPEKLRSSETLNLSRFHNPVKITGGDILSLPSIKSRPQSMQPINPNKPS